LTNLTAVDAISIMLLLILFCALIICQLQSFRHWSGHLQAVWTFNRRRFYHQPTGKKHSVDLTSDWLKRRRRGKLKKRISERTRVPSSARKHSRTFCLWFTASNVFKVFT